MTAFFSSHHRSLRAHDPRCDDEPLVRLDELPVLQDIERAAGQCFRDIGMPETAEDEPLPLGELTRYHHTGPAWVAADGVVEPVAYLIVDRVDGNLHVEQVSVHPDSARHGLGCPLLDHLAGHAASVAVPAPTLTTFARAPSNAAWRSHDMQNTRLDGT